MSMRDAIWIVGIFVALGATWGMTSQRINAMERDIDRIEEALILFTKMESRIAVIETEIKNINKKLDRLMIDMNKLLESVKRHEGYKNHVYLDTLGKRTVGVGHLCVEDFWEDDKEYEEDFLMGILEKDLQSAIDQADDMCKNLTISDDAKIIIIEMIFQLGGNGVSKFRKMWQALQQDPPDYAEASVQMLDSRWAKQTPNRAQEMAKHMKECG
tara:strand:+ start:3351 stop:3992 length:642 start_codon:yes stop_codon:yes gene_type:complete